MDKEKLLNSNSKKSTKTSFFSNKQLKSTESIQPSTSGYTNNKNKSLSNAENLDKHENDDSQSMNSTILKEESLKINKPPTETSESPPKIVESNVVINDLNTKLSSDTIANAKASCNQIKTSLPIMIDHRLSLSSMSSLNSSLKPKSNNLNNIINELDKEYNSKKNKQLNRELHINTNTDLVANTDMKHTKQESLSSNTSTLSANSGTDKDIKITASNFNNTVMCRYKNFEKKRNSITSTTLSSDQSDANKTTANANKEQPTGQVFDFGSRINKLRFIDDSASSTALTSPAESINHYHLGQHQQQQQHRFLNSNNFKKNGSNSTSSSRTVSLSVSTNNSSCCSTPLGSVTKRPSLTNRAVVIKRQENVKSSTENLSNDPFNENNNLSSSPLCIKQLDNKPPNYQLQHQNLTLGLQSNSTAHV